MASEQRSGQAAGGGHYVHAGVGYEPLRRLAPLLGVFGLDVLSAVVWPVALAYDEDEPDGEDDEDEHNDEEEDEDWEDRALRTLADADELAAELAGVVLERAAPYAGWRQRAARQLERWIDSGGDLR